MEELIGKLKVKQNTAIAKAVRTDDPARSFWAWKDAELMGKAIDGLKRNIPLEMEMEGGGSSWWYVCPECHEAIDKQDRFCRHCGQAVKA